MTAGLKGGEGCFGPGTKSEGESSRVAASFWPDTKVGGGTHASNSRYLIKMEERVKTIFDDREHKSWNSCVFDLRK